MIQIFKDLNDDQLDGLANLSFDLARAAFILAIFPASGIPADPLMGIFKIVLSLFWGLVCTYIALVLLNAKKKI